MPKENPRADVSIDIDLFQDIIEAIDGQINIMTGRLKDNDVNIEDDLQKAYQNITDNEIKYEINKMIRMQLIANKLDDFLNSLNQE